MMEQRRDPNLKHSLTRIFFLLAVQEAYLASEQVSLGALGKFRMENTKTGRGDHARRNRPRGVQASVRYKLGDSFSKFVQTDVQRISGSLLPSQDRSLLKPSG